MRFETEEGLRAALNEAPAPDLHGVSVGDVMRRGRRRRLARRGAAASLVVVLLAAGAAAAAALAGGSEKTAVPASDHEKQLDAWAACLNDQDSPLRVLTVVVPGKHGPEVQFLGDRPARKIGQPAPRPTLSDDDVRRIGGGYWQSALEACTPEEPGLVDEVEARWGDVTSGPAAQEQWMHSVDKYNETYHACLRAHEVVIPVEPASDAPIEDQKAYAEAHVAMYKQGVRAGCPYDPPKGPTAP